MAQFVPVSRDGVITVAAADTPSRLKERAHYVCDGTADEVQINAALAAAKVTAGQIQVDGIRTTLLTPERSTNAGTHIKLLPGSYLLAASIDVSSYRHVHIEGCGQGNTFIYMPSVGHGILAAYGKTHATAGAHFTIKDLCVQGDGSRGYNGIHVVNCQEFWPQNVSVHGASLDGIVNMSNTFHIDEDDDDDNCCWSWAASASGTAEYYLVYFQSKNSGKGVNHHLQKPDEVRYNWSTVAPEATEALGSIPAGEWKWGDNDSIGYDTLYVRLSDGSKPDPGDVRIAGYTTGNHIVTNCSLQFNGKAGMRALANHETLIDGTHIEENVICGLWLDQCVNNRIDGCNIEDNVTGSAAGLGLKMLRCHDFSVSDSVIENRVEASTKGGAFGRFNGNHITGAVALLDDFQLEGGANQGIYSIVDTNIAGVFSCESAKIIAVSGNSFIRLGNISVGQWEASACTFEVDGTTSKMTIEENGDVSDSSCDFAACHLQGTTSNDVYGFEFTDNDSHAFSWNGGKMRGMTINFTVSSSTLDDVVISGANLRTTAITVTGVETLCINGNSMTGGSANITIDDVDGGINIGSNIFNNQTITVNATCAATGVFVGNSDNAASGATTFTNNGTGTWVNASNAGITGGS